MKKIILTIVSAWVCASLFASDVRLTTTAAVYPANNGEILIEIDPSLGNAPFTINITTQNGYAFSQQILGYTLNKINLSPNVYCVQVISSTGCIANACIEVESCRFVNNKYNCTSKPAPCCLGDIVVGGSLIDSLTGNETENSFYYYWQNGLDSLTFSLLQSSLLTSTSLIVNQLLVSGSTVFDTIAQSAFTDPNIKFVISYNNLGQVNWVWNNLVHNINRESSETQNSFYIYPNPAHKHINVKLTPGVYKSLQVVDMYGHQLYNLEIEIATSAQLIDLSTFVAGIYNLILFTNDNKFESKSFFVK